MFNEFDDLRNIANDKYKKSKQVTNSPEKALILLQQSIDKLNEIPEKIRLFADWKNIARCYNKMEKLCGSNTQKIQYTTTAIRSFERIPINKCTTQQLYKLACLYNKLGCLLNVVESKRENYQKALNTLEFIPERSFGYWRFVSWCQCNMGHITKGEQQFKWYQEAIATIVNNIPERERSVEDWRDLCNYQDYAARGCQNDKEKRTLYENAIASVTYIPLKCRTSAIRRDLAICLNSLGSLDIKNNDWKRAHYYFYVSLDAHLNIDDMEENDYGRINGIYNQLVSLSLPSSLENNLFVFAEGVFSKTAFVDFKKELFQLHLFILNITPHLVPRILLRGLIQFMYLIDTHVDKANFPNVFTKDWLKVPENRNLFKQKLHELEVAYQPLSLLDAVDQAPTLSVAIVTRLFALEDTVQNLMDKIKSLEDENTLLKATRQPHLNPYQRNLTLFAENSAVNESSIPNNGDEENDRVQEKLRSS